MRIESSRRTFLSASLALAGGCSHIELERRIRGLLASHAVPGLGLAVIRESGVRWRGNFGVQDSESRTPVTDRTLFEAASMSKPVFAYAVMKLCEKGILNLDTPLTRYTAERFLPEDPRLDRITARHVLSHTTGFPDIRSSSKPLRIDFQPGEKWQYSGEGYAYLQAVVTRLAGRTFEVPCGNYEADLKVCGTDFDDFMRANVLGPLGMHASGYVWNEAMAGVVARPHDDRGRPLPDSRPGKADAARYGSMGGLLTTVSDYAKFVLAMLKPGSADAFRLSRASVNEMLRPQVDVEAGRGYSIRWALGWKATHSDEFGDIIAHGGDQTGFHCLAELSVARKSGYVLMTNGENGWKLIQEFAPELARQVHLFQ